MCPNIKKFAVLTYSIKNLGNIIACYCRYYSTVRYNTTAHSTQSAVSARKNRGIAQPLSFKVSLSWTLIAWPWPVIREIFANFWGYFRKDSFHETREIWLLLGEINSVLNHRKESCEI